MKKDAVLTIGSVLAALLLAMADAGQVKAAEVAMSGNVLPPASLGTVASAGSGATNDPYVYSFATSNGLSMGEFSIYGNNASNKNIKLNLQGGSITAAANGSGFYTYTNLDLKTAVSGGYASGVAITNVANIRIGKLWTYLGFGYANNEAGSVLIGADASGQRAGRVEISEIQAYNIGYGGNDYTFRYRSGSVEIYGSSDVLIWDGNTAGDICTYAPGRYYGYGWGIAAPVTIKHDGSFRARDIQTYCTAADAGNVLLNGDANANGADGSCQVNSFDVRNTFAGNPGQIVIQGYRDVTIGSVNASSVAGTGGTVTVSCSGEIGINGSIDLNGKTNSMDGVLSLTTSGGSITLDSLDLSLIGTATLSHAQRCEVTGTVANFSTSHTGGAGTPGDPFITTQTRLRLPAGQRVMYQADVPGNAYLAGAAYRVASPAGAAGAGGILMKYQARGTAITIK